MVRIGKRLFNEQNDGHVCVVQELLGKWYFPMIYATVSVRYDAKI
jgi:hypothetical protein